MGLRSTVLPSRMQRMIYSDEGSGKRKSQPGRTEECLSKILIHQIKCQNGQRKKEIIWKRMKRRFDPASPPPVWSPSRYCYLKRCVVLTDIFSELGLKNLDIHRRWSWLLQNGAASIISQVNWDNKQRLFHIYSKRTSWRILREAWCFSSPFNEKRKRQVNSLGQVWNSDHGVPSSLPTESTAM